MTHTRTARVVILGGGIIGLAAGWRLLREGQAVVIVERGRAGAAASHAAAGMLAAHAESDPAAPEFALARRGLDLWPDFAARLEDATGVDLHLRLDGVLVLAADERTRAGLRARFDAGRARMDVRWLEGPDVHAAEPAAEPRMAAGLLFPKDGQVDNRRVVDALRRAFLRAGGLLAEGSEATGLIVSRGAACGVTTPDGPVEGDCVVVAAGAWSGGLAGLGPEPPPPVRPVKGQMAAVQGAVTPPRRVIWGSGALKGVYLVPHAGGKLLVGATMEEAGFDTSVSDRTITRLCAAASHLVPGVAAATVIGSWAGLRPGTPDNLPIIGPGTISGLVWATGHHRNGILLAPLTALAVCQAVRDGELPPEFNAVAPDRFADKKKKQAGTAG